MIINEYFKEEYLTCGRTRDNFIFENCPIEFIKIAQELLNNDSVDIKACNVTITSEEEKLLEQTLNMCLNDLQKNALERDFITANVMLEVVKGIKGREEEKKMFADGLMALLTGDFQKSKKFHLDCPMQSEIGSIARETGKIELNLFLIDTKSPYLQRAINNLISSREPYSIKIFTNNERLPSYRDQAGNIIQCPHDFMTRNVNDFIEHEEEIESE